MPSAIRRSWRVKTRLFEGDFYDAFGAKTTHVRWSTAPFRLADGPVEGRLAVTPRTSFGIGEAVSSVPEKCQATLELDNLDGALTRYVIGTEAGPGQEYRGDSLLNLRGRLYACYLLEDGTYDKQPLTPMLACSGSPTITETTITLPMASDDTTILGKPRPTVTMGQLRGVPVVQPGDKFSLHGADRGYNEDFQALERALSGNLDVVLPYAYGRVPVPLIPADGDGKRLYLLFASKHKPTLSDAAEWDFFGPPAKRDEVPLAGKTATEERFKSALVSAQVELEDDEGETHAVWIVWLETTSSIGARIDDTIWALAPGTNLLSASAAGRGRATPPSIARWLIEDLSEAGAAGVDVTSFTAAAKALPLPDACGGLVRGDGDLRELLTHIGSPWALSWWIGLDDKLHVGVPGQWSEADRAAIKSSDTPHITPADFAAGYGAPGSYAETIPADPEQRGSAVRKVSLEWSDAQRAAWPAHELPRWAPGATELPVQPGDEARLSAAWLYPPAAVSVLASGGARRVFPTRRITLHMHDWIGVLERQSIVLFSMPGRYERRALRLEHTADDSREYVVARFEDLGPTSAQKPALYDSIDNWIGLSPTAGQGISVTAGSDLVWFGIGAADDKLVGMHLHTPGGTPGNRAIARRITERVDSAQMRVEFPFVDTESFVGVSGKPVLDQPWHILKSQANKPANDTYLTAADESTGTFRDGSPGFTVAAG